MPGLVNIDAGTALAGIGQLAKDIRTAITGIDPAKQAEIEEKLAEMENSAMNAQASINQVEAASASKFVSWWRPAVGWTCVAALSIHYLLMPIAQWALESLGYSIKLFQVDLSELYPLLIGLLGLGGLRTWEKIKGVQGSH